MLYYTNDSRSKPLTKNNIDEAINFWEDMMAECEDEEDATDCYTFGLEPDPEPDYEEDAIDFYTFGLEPWPEPDKILEATLAKDAIAKVLSKLPMECREVLKLRYFEGLSPEEIGIRFWPQLGYEGPITAAGVVLIERRARFYARLEFYRMGITSSKDLLPQD